MSKVRKDKKVECPKCFHQFDRETDVINKKCSRCQQWRPVVDFRGAVFVCNICRGVPLTRFSTQVRIRTAEGNLLKQCTKCTLWKPEVNYSKESKAKDGLQAWCMDCNNKFQAEKRNKKPELVEAAQ